MQLKKYLEVNKIKIVAFAAECGITYRTLWMYLKGGDLMLRTAKKISEGTDGQVTLEDLWCPSKNIKK